MKTMLLVPGVKKNQYDCVRFTFSSKLGNEMLFQDLKFGPDRPAISSS
jgi:hypothetical protein